MMAFNSCIVAVTNRYTITPSKLYSWLTVIVMEPAEHVTSNAWGIHVASHGYPAVCAKMIC